MIRKLKQRIAELEKENKELKEGSSSEDFSVIGDCDSDDDTNDTATPRFGCVRFLEVEVHDLGFLGEFVKIPSGLGVEKQMTNDEAVRIEPDNFITKTTSTTKIIIAPDNEITKFALDDFNNQIQIRPDNNIVKTLPDNEIINILPLNVIIKLTANAEQVEILPDNKICKFDSDKSLSVEVLPDNTIELFGKVEQTRAKVVTVLPDMAVIRWLVAGYDFVFIDPQGCIIKYRNLVNYLEQPDKKKDIEYNKFISVGIDNHIEHTLSAQHMHITKQFNIIKKMEGGGKDIIINADNTILKRVSGKTHIGINPDNYIVKFLSDNRSERIQIQPDNNIEKFVSGKCHIEIIPDNKIVKFALDNDDDQVQIYPDNLIEKFVSGKAHIRIKPDNYIVKFVSDYDKIQIHTDNKVLLISE